MKLSEVLKEGDRWYGGQERWNSMKDITKGNEVFRRGGGMDEILRDMEKRGQYDFSKMSPQDQQNMAASDQGFIDWLFSRGLIRGRSMEDLADLETKDANSLYREYNKGSSHRSRYAQGTP